MKLHATGRDLLIKESERLISGSVNIYTCEFTFDESWDGYTVTAVFSTGNRLVNMAVVDGKCDIPTEVLRPNARIRVGVFGIDGDRRRPTTYSEWIPVEQGVDLSGSSAQPPTPSVYEQWLNGLEAKQEEWNANEEARAEAEAARVEAENARVAAEEERKALETGYVAQAEAWAKEAEDQANEAKSWADKAQEVVGGDYATKAQAQGYADTAESNANEYTDKQIAAIPTPDVSGQIGSHNTDETAHADIRQAISEAVGNVYTKAETLTDDTKALFGLDSGAVPNDLFEELSDSLNKVGDIKTTIRTDLGDNWLLCNGEAIDQTAYPELYNLNQFSMYESLFEDLTVEGTILDVYVDADLLMVITNGTDRINLTAYMKHRGDSEWSSQVVYASSGTNYIYRAKISLIENMVCVLFDKYFSSSQRYIYGIQYDKETATWSSEKSFFSDASTNYKFTPVRYDGTYYYFAYSYYSNSYVYCAYTTSFLGTWGKGFSTGTAVQNPLDVAFYSGHYCMWVQGGTQRPIKYRCSTISGSGVGSNKEYTAQNYFCGENAVVRIVGDDYYFCYAFEDFDTSQYGIEIRKSGKTSAGEATANADSVRVTRILGVDDTVKDMVVYDNKIYVMASGHIYEYDTETFFTQFVELGKTLSVGKLDFDSGKMLGAVGTTVYESKPSVPKIALADTYTYIKAKE